MLGHGGYDESANEAAESHPLPHGRGSASEMPILSRDRKGAGAFPQLQ